MAFFSQFAKLFRHVEESGLVAGIGDLLRQSDAFRGIKCPQLDALVTDRRVTFPSAHLSFEIFYIDARPRVLMRTAFG